MTTIVGVTDNSGLVTIGTDSFYSTGGWTREMRHEKKIIRIRPRIAVATAGTVRLLNIIRDADPTQWDQAASHFDQSHGERGAVALGRTLRSILLAERYIARDGDIDLLPERSQIMVAASPGMLYVIGTDFSVGSLKCGYTAIGTGGEVALGSLHTTAAPLNGRSFTSHDRVLLALRAAAEHAVHVAEPFDIEEITYS